MTRSPPRPPPAALFAQALDAHGQGRLPEARRLYKAVLQAQPGHAQALNNLGLVHQQTGHMAEALACIDRALRLDPHAAQAHYNRGVTLAALNRHDDAAAAYGRAVAFQPELAQAHFNLGVTLERLEQPDSAAAAYRRAAALAPQVVEIWCNLGALCLRQGQPEAATQALTQSLAVNAGYAPAHHNLGLVLEESGDRAGAAARYRRALACDAAYMPAAINLGLLLRGEGDRAAACAVLETALVPCPAHVDALLNLSVLHGEMGRPDRAQDCLRRLIAADPAHPQAHAALGRSLRSENRLDESRAAFAAGVRARPKEAMAHVYLGVAFEDVGRYDDALACYRKAVAVEPARPEARLHEAYHLLLRGRYPDGWAAYESRRRCADYRVPVTAAPDFTVDLPAGARVLVHAEQGFGDTFQFARYVPMLIAQGYHVVFEVQPELRGLMASLAGAEIIAWDDPLPAADAAIPLLSLPGRFGTTIDTIPWSGPYLAPDPKAQAAWSRRLAALDPAARPRIGLVWAGRQTDGNAHRSVPLSAVLPLFDGLDATVVSLQKALMPGDADLLAAHPHITPWGAGLADFADTAALLASLDLVVTIDTAVAHLAGALGRPTWAMLPFDADWRWLLNRADSPWYPETRLFRQSRPRDWAAVLDQVRTALAGFGR